MTTEEILKLAARIEEWEVSIITSEGDAFLTREARAIVGRALRDYARPEGGAMTPSEASNKVLEIRDKTVMSKYASQTECKAARDALWEAACALRWAEQSTPQKD
jgi:hypothetical protein